LLLLHLLEHLRLLLLLHVCAAAVPGITAVPLCRVARVRTDMTTLPALIISRTIVR
jgi:hypothetical protein